MKVTKCDNCGHELGGTSIGEYPWVTAFSFLDHEYCLLCLQEAVAIKVRAVMEELASRLTRAMYADAQQPNYQDQQPYR